MYLLAFLVSPRLTREAGILYANPVTFEKYCRGAASCKASRHLPFIVGLKAVLVSAALLAPLGAALAAPQSLREPALRPLDDHGILDTVADKFDSVADKGTELISQVRDGASGLVDSAMNFLGVRYKLGGNTAETGFDCSGFTRYVFENSIGRVLPHRADEQANDPGLAKVEHKDLKPGDLVFFNTMRRTFSHVGIYLGDGKFIHSPKSGESVRIEDINISYWARHFTGARRAPELAGAGGSTAAGAGSMLASLTARLSGQSAAATTGQAAAPVQATTPAVTASMNPSGLRLGSTLPSLPNANLVGVAPLHQPFVRALGDR